MALENRNQDWRSRKAPPATEPPAAFNVPSVVLVVTGLLVVIHVLRAVLPVAWSSTMEGVLALIPLRYLPDSLLGNSLPGGPIAGITGFLTCFFIQTDPGMLMINGAALLILGAAVAWRFGTWRFLGFLALCTIAGSLTCLAFFWGSPSLVVGAGGGLSGLFGAGIHFMFKGGSPISAFQVAGGAAFRKPAWALRDALADQNVRIWIAIFAFITLWYAVAPYILTAVSNYIAWPANVGGFAAGLLLFRFFDTLPRLRRVV